VPATRPGEAEFNLVRNRLAAFTPSAENIKMLRETGESASCADPKTAPVSLFQVRGNLALVRTEKFMAMPGNAGCLGVFFLLEFSDGKWQILDLPDAKDNTQPRLVDINNDGFQDIIFFRNFHGDGPGPMVTAVYMSGRDGVLAKHTTPLFSEENCERSDDIRDDEYRDMTPGNLGLKCHDGENMISIEYDGTAGRFTSKRTKE